MNKLIKGLEKIMDLDDGETFRSEVSRKLTNTVMIINGSLVLVTDFMYNQCVIIGYDLKAVKNDRPVEFKVNSIEVFTPESGLFVTEEGYYLYITKIPKKQWFKSFCDPAYTVIRLNGNLQQDTVSWRQVLGIKSLEKKNIILAKNGNIFYHDLNVGSVLGDKVICNNSLFKQELIDWVRDARR